MPPRRATSMSDVPQSPQDMHWQVSAVPTIRLGENSLSVDQAQTGDAVFVRIRWVNGAHAKSAEGSHQMR